MSAAVDIGLDPDTDDLPDLPELITGLDLIQQLIASTVRFFLGEWFLDERVGLPLVEWITTKAPDVQAILARLEQDIRTIPGVVRTEDGIAILTGRTISCTMTVITRSGDATTVSILQDADGLRNGSPFAVYFRSNRISGAV